MQPSEVPMSLFKEQQVFNTLTVSGHRLHAHR